MIAAPSLLTLTMFDFDDTEWVYCITSNATFPKLRDLVAFEQDILDVVLWAKKAILWITTIRGPT